MRLKWFRWEYLIGWMLPGFFTRKLRPDMVHVFYRQAAEPVMIDDLFLEYKGLRLPTFCRMTDQHQYKLLMLEYRQWQAELAELSALTRPAEAQLSGR